MRLKTLWQMSPFLLELPSQSHGAILRCLLQNGAPRQPINLPSLLCLQPSNKEIQKTLLALSWNPCILQEAEHLEAHYPPITLMDSTGPRTLIAS